MLSIRTTFTPIPDSRRRFALLCALVSIFIACPLWSVPARAQQQGLVMGLLSSETREIMLKTWQPIIDDLGRAIGTPITPVALDDYAGVIWYLAKDKAQLAWLGNKSAIEAVDRANCEVIAKTLNPDGAGYYAHIIARVDSGLNNVDDVIRRSRELTFGNGDPNSTSGFVVPGYYVFAERGIDPKAIFKRMHHANHLSNFNAVVNGDVDVATSNSLSVRMYREWYPDRFAQVKIIWTSPLIPSDPIVVRKDLDPALKEQIVRFLEGYGQPAEGKSAEQLEREQRLLEARKLTGFQRSDNSQLLPIRRLELYKQRLQIENDAKLGEDVRARQLAEINTRLQALDR